MLPGKVKIDIDYIAMKLKMAKSTVSKALNGRPDVSEATKEKVKLFAKKMNYTPDRLAQSLKTRKSNLIGVVMHEMKREFFVELARSVAREAQSNGCQAVFASSEGSAESEKAIMRDLISRRIDGLIVIPCVDGSHAHLQEVAQDGYPLVIADNCIEGVDAPFVGTDFEEGSYLAVKHMLENGRREIGLILGPESLPSTVERLAGCKRALAEAGATHDPARVKYGDYSSEAGRKAAEKLLEESPGITALFCANVDISEGAASALAKLGKADDVLLIDFGGTRPPCIDQRTEELGRIATQTLLHLINGGKASRKTVVKPKLSA